MKLKYLGSLIIMMCASSAWAQSSVTLYGSIDEGITFNSNAQGSRTATVGPVAVPDFYGLRGTEDLGNQLSAVFALQNGFKSNTGQGTIAGDAFSQMAWVGLSSPQYGRLTLGRQLDLATDVLRVNANGSIQYNFYLFHPANLDDLGITGDSINNSVKYTTPTIDGFTASGLYGLADSSTQPGRVYSADLVYARGSFRASAVYTSWRDHTINLISGLGETSFMGESLANGALFTAKRQDIAGLSAFYKPTDKIQLHGVLTQVDLATVLDSTRMRTVELGGDYLTNFANTITLGGYVSWLGDTRYEEAGIGDVYSLSSRTVIYAQVTYQRADGAGDAAMPLLAAANGPNQTAIRVGIHHFF
jgi:predicted porin